MCVSRGRAEAELTRLQRSVDQRAAAMHREMEHWHAQFAVRLEIAQGLRPRV